MKLSADTVKKVAQLANLTLTSTDESRYADQLSKILDYIDQLDKAKTEGVEPTYNVTGNTNVTRPDEMRTSLTQDQALQNAVTKNNGYFVTKGVFEE
jgi:aspartyl-tRNA(Asn)/glutamyl-tRNA(Gln) amidotransferase subunit C